MSKAWEKLSDESADAYHAFCLYRDIQPSGRTLNTAYQRYLSGNEAPAGNKKAQLGNKKVPHAPGNWRRWSGKFKWESRAAEWDYNIDARQTKAIERESEKNAERRAKAFEEHRLNQLESMVSASRGLKERLERDGGIIINVEERCGGGMPEPLTINKTDIAATMELVERLEKLLGTSSQCEAKVAAAALVINVINYDSDKLQPSDKSQPTPEPRIPE